MRQSVLREFKHLLPENSIPVHHWKDHSLMWSQFILASRQINPIGKKKIKSVQSSSSLDNNIKCYDIGDLHSTLSLGSKFGLPKLHLEPQEETAADGNFYQTWRLLSYALNTVFEQQSKLLICRRPK